VPKNEMKVLYWNRIQIFKKSEAIWFDVEDLELPDDFESLFSKAPPQKINKKAKQTNGDKEVLKLLDSKRSQAVGIFISSKRLDSQIIKDALIGFDSQLLSHETLNAIFNIRPHDEEIRMINDCLKNATEDSLDKPELFLLELSRISGFEERIYCLVYQNKFYEALSSIEYRLNNIKNMCDELVLNDKVKKILGIILSCGNIMNANNKVRGDADGFDLAIMTNLKDVKSKDNSMTLLSYVACFYVFKCDDSSKFPLPEPSDVSFTANINFNEIEKELKRFEMELKDIQSKTENVLRFSSEEEHEPFKTNMIEFLKSAADDLKEEAEHYKEVKKMFDDSVNLFNMKPKTGENEVSPEYFFFDLVFILL